MKVTDIDVAYALQEWKERFSSPSHIFEWERELKNHSPNFWNFVSILMEGSNTFNENAIIKKDSGLRTLFHLAIAPIYSAYGKKLPSIYMTDFKKNRKKIDAQTGKEQIFFQLAQMNQKLATNWEKLFLTIFPDGMYSLNFVAAIETIISKINNMTMQSDYLVKFAADEKVNFNQIGGLVEAKRKVERLVVALTHPERYKHWGTKAPRGIVFYGPPGTGKTLLAKALASVTNVPFYNVPSSKLLSMWYSKSSKNVDKIFDEAKKTGGILFFDEADALVPSRENSYQHEATNRVIAALNQNMSGFTSSDKIIVIFATNRLQDLDEAIIRAGRIDLLIEIPLPDEEARKQIFKIHMKKAEKIAERKLFKNVNVSFLAKKTDGYSGADIAEIVRRTLEDKVEEEEDDSSVPTFVTSKDLIKEINGYERKKSSEEKIVGFVHGMNRKQ